VTAGQVLTISAARGVILRAEAGRVRWIAPAGAVTPELRAAIRDCATPASFATCRVD